MLSAFSRNGERGDAYPFGPSFLKTIWWKLNADILNFFGMHSNTSSFSGAAPVNRHERIEIIDSLRGIAVLGIPLMNIPFFALPYLASNDLTVNNELGTVNEKVWYFTNWFLEGSQRAIFSMLFGAGIKRTGTVLEIKPTVAG